MAELDEHLGGPYASRYQLWCFPHVLFSIFCVLCAPLLARKPRFLNPLGVRDKENERKVYCGVKPCGCYVVMHGLVIATIQPAYKRGSASIPNSDLRFIASGWIADFQIPQFVLINSSY